VGACPGLTALSERLGVTCAPRANLDPFLNGPQPDHKSLVLRGTDPQIDAAVAVVAAEDEQWLRASLSELRLVKDEWEIGQVRAAVELSVAYVLRGSADEVQ
jgi:Xaa-Pro aminopeptidase